VGIKRVLLLYISVLSGHHRAAMAMEDALKRLNPDTEIYSINSFNYTNPILEKVINRTYNGVIKRTPEVWEYLYDNPKVVKNTQRIKEMIHRYNSSKMQALFDDFKPDVIACTQAFPCGIVADYKATFKSNVSLVGVLTDFYPHSYWVYETVDKYVVASEDARAKLIENGVSPDKISVFGIPINNDFQNNPDVTNLKNQLGLDDNLRTVLIMGGSGGLGPIKRIIAALERVNTRVQAIVITGTNTKLHTHLRKIASKLKNKIVPIGYTNDINNLMTVADMVVTKPGGLTISEALAKSLPIIIINPIPGQEAKNTQFLLKEQAAIKADNEEELAILIENLCTMPSKLEAMSNAAAALGKPESADNIAKMMLEL